MRVELDGAELIGYGANKEPILIPLSNVQAVWHHRLRKLRSVGIIGGVMSGTSAIGAMLMAAIPGAVLGGAVLGVTLGVPLGFCAVILLEESEVLYEWVLLYDRAAA